MGRQPPSCLHSRYSCNQCTCCTMYSVRSFNESHNCLLSRPISLRLLATLSYLCFITATAVSFEPPGIKLSLESNLNDYAGSSGRRLRHVYYEFVFDEDATRGKVETFNLEDKDLRLQLSHQMKGTRTSPMIIHHPYWSR